MDRTVLCLVALALAIVLWFLKKAPKPHAVAAFIAMAGLVGGAVGGWLPRVLLWLDHWLVVLENKLTGLIFGGTDPGVVASILAAVAIGIVLHDLWPKNQAKRRTVVLAAIAPLLMLAAGGQMAAALNGNLGPTFAAPAAAPAAVSLITNTSIGS
jgi:hypothetical protein